MAHSGMTTSIFIACGVALGAVFVGRVDVFSPYAIVILVVCAFAWFHGVLRARGIVTSVSAELFQPLTAASQIHSLLRRHNAPPVVFKQFSWLLDDEIGGSNRELEILLRR